MPWIRVVEQDQADGKLKEAYERIRSARGKLSNIMMIQSLDPEAMQAHLELYMALLFSRSGLSREEREAIAVVVSARNGCAYCVNHHAAALRAYWKDDARVRELGRDYRTLDLSPRLRAILDYAALLTRDPAAVTEAHVRPMLNEGLSDEEVLNVNMVTSYFNFVNRIAEGLGVEFTGEEVAGYRY
jgi:uncharacterized peroxidase-related enzyme